MELKMTDCLKLIGALAVVMAASRFEATAEDLDGICGVLQYRMTIELPPKEEGNPERALSFANDYLVRVMGLKDSAEVGKLRAAWAQIIRESDCSDASLEQLATVAKCKPEASDSMRTLAHATRSYAGKCLTPNLISKLLKSRTERTGCFLTSCFKSNDIDGLIDQQFIADYKSQSPTETAPVQGASDDQLFSKAVAKAVFRQLKRKGKDPNTKGFIHDKSAVSSYLSKRLVKPCNRYVTALEKVVDQIILAGAYFEGGATGLISSQEQETQAAFLHYALCVQIVTDDHPHLLASQVMQHLQPEEASKRPLAAS